MKKIVREVFEPTSNFMLLDLSCDVKALQTQHRADYENMVSNHPDHHLNTEANDRSWPLTVGEK